MAPTLFEEGQKDLTTKYYVGRESSNSEGRNFITTSYSSKFASLFVI